MGEQGEDGCFFGPEDVIYCEALHEMDGEEMGRYR